MSYFFILLLPLLLFSTATPPSEPVPVILEQSPTLQATFRKCGDPVCLYCCVTFRTSLQGRIEYRMHKIYQGGQVEPTEYGSYTGGSTWNYGIVGDPDPFVIKYRNVGSNTWHQSQVIIPTGCCYP